MNLNYNNYMLAGFTQEEQFALAVLLSQEENQAMKTPEVAPEVAEISKQELTPDAKPDVCESAKKVDSIAQPVLLAQNNESSSSSSSSSSSAETVLSVLNIEPDVAKSAENTNHAQIVKMAEDISSEEEIQSLTAINGVAIKTIEERAKPNKLSDTGFLGEDESLQAVLLQDWKTVRALGTTHVELANELHSLIEAVNKGCGKITYTPSILKNGKPQELEVFFLATRGVQYCIFDRSFGWSTSCKITNISTGASIEWSEGVERYIRKYGFYEGGGKENPYRVDPIALMSIFTGESQELLQKKGP